MWLAGRMIGWALVLPALARFVPLPSLTAWLSHVARRRRRTHDPEQIVLFVRAIYGRKTPLRNNCLVRSLLAYRFLVEARSDVRLVVAIRPGIDGHVWVTLDDRPVLEDEAALTRFEPLFFVGSHGRVERISELSR
jgi:hypothetical protein